MPEALEACLAYAAMRKRLQLPVLSMEELEMVFCQARGERRVASRARNAAVFTLVMAVLSWNTLPTIAAVADHK